MNELGELVEEIGLLRKDLEALRHQVVSGSFIPAFTRNIMTATLVCSILAAVLGLFIAAELYLMITKIHAIYSLMI